MSLNYILFMRKIEKRILPIKCIDDNIIMFNNMELSIGT